MNKDTFVRWIMPGCWEDADGNVHFDIPAIHKLMGCPPELDTPEEREDTARKLAQIFREYHPDAQLIIRTEPGDEEMAE